MLARWLCIIKHHKAEAGTQFKPDNNDDNIILEICPSGGREWRRFPAAERGQVKMSRHVN